jgi:hypothetical protein
VSSVSPSAVRSPEPAEPVDESFEASEPAPATVGRKSPRTGDEGSTVTV